MIVARAIAVLIALSAPVQAMTGGELLSADRAFGTGFVFGASSVFLQFQSPDLGAEYEAGRATCIERAKIGSNGLYDLAIARLKAEPRYLAAPASYVVATVLQEMCSL